MRLAAIVVLFGMAGAAEARDRIALVEFFGYGGMDVEAIRQALPVREGDAYSDAVKVAVRVAVKRVIGRDATDVQGICCDERGDRWLFVGLPGQSSRAFELNPTPGGPVSLSREIVDLHARMEEAEHEAVLKGVAGQDGSPGYRLAKYPPARKLELEVRRYALKHDGELRQVLGDGASAEQRAIAADALGYGRRSPEQITALVRACRDPNDSVRNNSTRALGELLSADPALGKQISADVFLEMIGSGVWTDRNKASFVLEKLARREDAEMLARVKSRAWEPLVEMARWRDTGHALMPRVVLGRIAGIPEERLMQIAFGPPGPFLDAIGAR